MNFGARLPLQGRPLKPRLAERVRDLKSFLTMRRPPFLPLMIAIALLGVTAFLGWQGGQKWPWIMPLGVMGAAFVSVWCCFEALREGRTLWVLRLQVAWASLAVSGVLFALGTLVSLKTLGVDEPAAPAPGDYFWIAQQPFLWLGLFLLAWRGRRIHMMRLLTDTLIVVLAAVVLSWSLLLEKLLSAEQLAPATRAIAIYYPVCDIAHLFCALILVAYVRDRSSLWRASFWVLAGVVCLIGADSLGTYFFFSRQPGNSLWIDALQGLGYPLLGAGALVHARTASAGDDEAGEDEAAPMRSTWENTLGGWHRGAMLWLPYLATLGVSGVLVGQEIRRSNYSAVERLLPILALLLAIVARQMLTLWDNLKLSEQLRVKAEDLELNVGERTRHLRTLHGITSTLNTSLDKRTVLRVALEQTLAAVDAEGGGIWLRDARRDVYASGVAGDEWTLVHWQGLKDDPAMPTMLRELSIADANRQSFTASEFKLSPATREAISKGLVPPKHQLIQVPIASHGELLGVMAMIRTQGNFTYEDRALVESVALEAGTALQNARLYSEAAERADLDSVTNLFNHRAVQERLSETLARCRRSGEVFSIVMMDLNNFKFFNDTYGHPVGDDVLRRVARALEESCRTSDVLGRYGGDEFIIVLPDTDGPGTLEVCQRIMATLDAHHIEPIAGTKLPIAISYGWSSFPRDGDSALELLTAADQNLYDHKRGNLLHGAERKGQSESHEELRRLKNRAVGGSFGVLDALVTAIDNKDHYTRHHSQEVTYLSLLVARELGYSNEQLQAVRISGLLHDVGKIAVPDDILRHPGKLGEEEWEIMQQHPVFGALIVKDVPHLEAVSDGIRYHHEKWDGRGYPEGLAGEAIPEMGRLLAMGDCYSALTTDRPYRKGWEPTEALEEIARCAGSHFDPHLCAVFLRVMERELELDGDTSDYGARIADDFGQLARNGQTKSSAPIVARETVEA